MASSLSVGGMTQHCTGCRRFQAGMLNFKVSIVVRCDISVLRLKLNDLLIISDHTDRHSRAAHQTGKTKTVIFNRCTFSSKTCAGNNTC